MVFSATKGMASTVIHRLVDRGLIDYDAPVAEYWPEFGANGKADDHRSRRAAAPGRSVPAQRRQQGRPAGPRHDGGAHRRRPVGLLRGRPAYHAVTYGWLVSGLARAVTGRGMRELFRTELAEPLGTDGVHLGRPPAARADAAGPDHRAAEHAAEPDLQSRSPRIWPRCRSPAVSGRCTSRHEVDRAGRHPAAGQRDARGQRCGDGTRLARMYGADRQRRRPSTAPRFLSPELVAGLTGPRSLHPDGSLGHADGASTSATTRLPLPGVLPGFGHVGLGGSLGWADPATGLAFGYVHNRLLTPLVVADQAGLRGDRGASSGTARRARGIVDSRPFRGSERLRGPVRRRRFDAVLGVAVRVARSFACCPQICRWYRRSQDIAGVPIVGCAIAVERLRKRNSSRPPQEWSQHLARAVSVTPRRIANRVPVLPADRRGNPAHATAAVPTLG